MRDRNDSICSLWTVPMVVYVQIVDTKPLSLLPCGGRYLRNGTEHSENMEQLCTPLLQCRISTSCIWLDGARRVLHAGTLVAQILASRKNWMRKNEGGSSRTANSGRNTNTNPQVPAVISTSVQGLLSSIQWYAARGDQTLQWGLT